MMISMNKRRQILGIMLFYSLSAGITALCVGGTSTIFADFVQILSSPSQLTLDYFKIASVAATFLNVALVGLSCTLVFALSGAELNGTSLMAFFLTIGFSFFGMNFLNIWPCIWGTWLFSRLSRETFAAQVNIAVFSTALSPFVSEAIWRYPVFDCLPAAMVLKVLLGALLGMAAGFLMPILCRHSPNLHRGYTLYNAAAVAGFIGILLFSLMYRAVGIEAPSNTDIGGSYPEIVNGFIIGTSIAAIGVGFALNGWHFRGFSMVLKSTGYKCDFTKCPGVALTFMHIGTFGLLVAAYYNLIGASMTGPTAGSMVCLLAIAPCGAHLFNVLPVMLGYILASGFGAFEPNTQAIIVGLCFACALCPISGCFGSISGILAGFLHACMVTTVVSFHGGLCLYNGGFTCGITAILLVPVLEYFFQPSQKLRILPSRPRGGE